MTPKSAEALRVEAHEACGNCGGIRGDRNTSGQYGTEECGDLHDAIDIYAAARAVEVAEGMHVERCECFSCNDNSRYVDPRCTEARARLRAEMERLTHAD